MPKRNHSARLPTSRIILTIVLIGLLVVGVVVALPLISSGNGQKRDVNAVLARLVQLRKDNNNVLPTDLSAIIKAVTGESSAYYGSYDWANPALWNGVWMTPDEEGNAVAPIVQDNVGTTATIVADEFDYWVDAESTHPQEDPGRGPDGLPSEQTFDIFVGWRCQVSVLTLPDLSNPYYPNDTNFSATAPGLIMNQFVNEDGAAHHIAIVYRLEGEDIWYCKDNA